MFMVGVALPYSIAARRAKGDSFSLLLLHTIWRSLLLVLLAVFLSSAYDKRTSWVFTNVLAQIGLGYPFLFAIAWLRPRWQFGIAIAILVATWAAFALYPLPPSDFNYTSVGLPKDWPLLDGFAAHWNKNTNIAHHFDLWFLNLFPRETPFTFNRGGYETLNFVPALATMIFGLLAGGVLQSDRPQLSKVKWLLGAGAICLALGWTLDALGICPSVKRIWTPSWAIFSSGWTFLALATFYYVIYVVGAKGWAFPCVVVGMNSIAMYVMAQLCKGFVSGSVKIHFGATIFESLGKTYAPIVEFSVFLLVMWLVCFWMYRRKIFLKI
jgi:predicted acyltransferase